MGSFIRLAFSALLIVFVFSAQAQYKIRTDDREMFEKSFRHQEKLIGHISNIKIFVNNDTPVVAADWLLKLKILSTYNLDRLVEIENTVNETVMASLATKFGDKFSSLSDEKKMDLYMSEFQSLIRHSALIKRSLSDLEEASVSHLLMYAFQIKALPAIVVNDNTVLYGYSNVNRALNKFFEEEHVYEN